MEKTLNHNYETVFNKCKLALKKLDINIDSENKAKGIITASTGTSLLSWGEDIRISIKNIGASKTKISVTSGSRSQLISWGKNSENETKIINTIIEKLNK